MHKEPITMENTKMTNHFNKLTEQQAESLSILVEELGESIQAIGKIQRHGLDSRNPNIPDSPTNRENLERELGNVLFIVEALQGSGDLSERNITNSKFKKAESILPYLHHH